MQQCMPEINSLTHVTKIENYGKRNCK